MIGLALVCALMLACFAAVPRLGLEEPARVCVRVRVCAPICFNHDARTCFLAIVFLFTAIFGQHDTITMH